jgi:hypothetical protein
MNTGGPLSRNIINRRKIENITMDHFFKFEMVAGFKLEDEKDYDIIINSLTNFCKEKKYKTLDELKKLLELPKTRLLGVEAKSDDSSLKIIRNCKFASREEIMRNAVILSLTSESLIYDYERPVILNKKNLNRAIVFYNMGGFYANY